MSTGGQLAFEATLRVTAAISIALRILSTSTQEKSPDPSLVLSHGTIQIQMKHKQSQQDPGRQNTTSGTPGMCASPHG